MNPYVILQKYYSSNEEAYDILVNHSESVANKALSIAHNHPELKIDTEFVFQAAMLHDIGIHLTNAPSIACYGSYPYVCHGYLGSGILMEEQLPQHALVCERHTGTGISLEEIVTRKLPLPLRDMKPISLEEQLICFADLFFSKTHLEEELSTTRIETKLQKFSSHSVVQFHQWCDLFL